ncbi:hypothetical protein HanXRQr2_Chr01g0032031 [Helianthus annuus]|uniref:Uncharacterized protein n=1 Tax=Helianthus annuus TaxID=4232 RepID=A0A251VSD9_HELAN|nr:hypothetical protein HanXRQr2_Chr01g0032031 [Helianthus annuus]KAJ0957744.1 hypothetical protein HanPSC8_Chr01g0031231 [Helianthus annuus]
MIMEATTNIPLTKARKLHGVQSPSSKPNSGTTDQMIVKMSIHKENWLIGKTTKA